MSAGRCSPEPCARVQQHVLDDRIGALAVLHDLVEIALQHAGQLVDLRAQLARRAARLRAPRRSSSMSSTDSDGEIVDEIERVLDLVRDAGGELAERGELLGLDQAVLRGAQILERARRAPASASARFSNRRTFSIAITAWSAKVRPVRSAGR